MLSAHMHRFHCFPALKEKIFTIIIMLASICVSDVTSIQTIPYFATLKNMGGPGSDTRLLSCCAVLNHAPIASNSLDLFQSETVIRNNECNITSISKSELPANHCTVQSTETVITDSAPHVVMADFYSTFILVGTICQTNISFSAALTCQLIAD